MKRIYTVFQRYLYPALFLVRREVSMIRGIDVLAGFDWVETIMDTLTCQPFSSTKSVFYSGPVHSMFWRFGRVQSFRSEQCLLVKTPIVKPDF